ncbi:electron transporter [Actinomyces sp. HMSC062G12]|nr:electron transporter [Actinomyces sp. HMSC062G12]
MTQQMTSPILVLADQAGDRLTPLARQAVTLAASLTSGDVVALSVAAAPDTRSLSELGATRVLHACMGDAARSSAVASDAIIAALETDSFGLVLLGSDYRGREIAGRVGAITEAGVVSGVSSVSFDGGILQVGKTALGGSWSMRVVLDGITPIVGVSSGVIDEAVVPSPVALTPQELPVPLSAEASSIEVVSCVPDDADGVSLQDASTVVCGGRGVDGDFELVRSLASALGGAVGATRVACDEGWAPRGEQIGQTGLTLTPNLYIGLGVSGAIHHTVGMQSAAHIVAVCDDPDAPIFDIADFGVVGDVAKVVPAALAAIEEARAQA